MLGTFLEEGLLDELFLRYAFETKETTTWPIHC